MLPKFSFPSCHNSFPFSRYFPESGIRTCISSWRRINGNSTPPMAKAGGNYMNSVLATQECKRNGYDESIMLDYIGNVSEAPGENIFVIRKNKIYTPSLSDSVLEGITRDTAIKLHIILVMKSMNVLLTVRIIYCR